MLEWILENRLFVIGGLLILIGLAIIVNWIGVFSESASSETENNEEDWFSSPKEVIEEPFSDLASSETENFGEDSFSSPKEVIEKPFSDLASSETESFGEDWFSSPEDVIEDPFRSLAQESSSTEQVEFSVFSPEYIIPRSYFCLDVWAYLSNDYSYIQQLAKTLDRENVVGRKHGVPIERGTLLTIRLEMPGFEVKEPSDTMLWDGSPVNATFIVNDPQGVKIGSHPGKVTIAYNGISIAKISFVIKVATEGHSNYTDSCSNAKYPLTAFASYASENRDEVLSRIQGMKKIAPNLDIFIDAFSLRSGENWLEKLEEHIPSKDIFYLFWSHSAASSEWVEKEWRLALYRRGINYIDPVPLEDPGHAPPPQELNSLHFYDAYVTYISYERLKRQLGDKS